MNDYTGQKYSTPLDFVKMSIKGLIYINSIAIIAFLTFLGHIITSKTKIDVLYFIFSISSFFSGIVFGLFSTIAAGQSQYLVLSHKEKNFKLSKKVWFYITCICILLSIFLFLLGSIFFTIIIYQIILKL
jgi:hypothetical protein